MVSSYKVFAIREKHLEEVAAVHVQAFRDSALTRLGLEAVRRYYEWQLVGPHDHEFIGLFESNRLQGYAVGGISRGALAGFIKRNRGLLVLEMFKRPWLLLGKDFRRRSYAGFRVLSSRPRSSGGAPIRSTARSFGILAIAVAPTVQGKGLGRILMNHLEAAAAGKGFNRMHLTVAANNTNAIAFYQNIGWSRAVTGSGSDDRMEKDLVQTDQLVG